MKTTKNTSADVKKSAIVSVINSTVDRWGDSHLTCSYKGVDMTQKLYDIKMILEKRAKIALQDCRHTLKAVQSKVQCNNDFISLFASGKIADNCYKNSLTCQVIDKNTSVLYQTGLHFILAVRIDGKVFVNRFPFGNRTVTEQIRFDRLKIKTISFKDGTLKASSLEKLLFSCKCKEEAEKAAEGFKFPSPNIKGGVKNYLARCIATENK